MQWLTMKQNIEANFREKTWPCLRCDEAVCFFIRQNNNQKEDERNKQEGKKEIADNRIPQQGTDQTCWTVFVFFKL